MVLDLQFFHFMMVQKQYMFSINSDLNLDLFPRLAIYGTILFCDAGAG